LKGKSALETRRKKKEGEGPPLIKKIFQEREIRGDQERRKKVTALSSLYPKSKRIHSLNEKQKR